MPTPQPLPPFGWPAGRPLRTGFGRGARLAERVARLVAAGWAIHQSQHLVGTRVVGVAAALAEMAVEPLGERGRRLARGIVDIGRMFGDADRPAAARARLDRAGLVVRPVLAPVLVADVDFDPGQPILEPRKPVAHLRLDPLGDVRRAHDRTVGIELDLHWGALLSGVVWSPPEMGRIERDGRGIELRSENYTINAIIREYRLPKCPDFFDID